MQETVPGCNHDRLCDLYCKPGNSWSWGCDKRIGSDRLVEPDVCSWGKFYCRLLAGNRRSRRHGGAFSAYGWSLGYIGGLLVLGVCLGVVIEAQRSGIEAEDYIRWIMWIVAGVFRPRRDARVPDSEGKERLPIPLSPELASPQVGNECARRSPASGISPTCFDSCRRS